MTPFTGLHLAILRYFNLLKHELRCPLKKKNSELLLCEFGFYGCGGNADLFLVTLAALVVVDAYAAFGVKLQLVVPCL